MKRRKIIELKCFTIHIIIDMFYFAFMTQYSAFQITKNICFLHTIVEKSPSSRRMWYFSNTYDVYGDFCSAIFQSDLPCASFRIIITAANLLVILFATMLVVLGWLLIIFNLRRIYINEMIVSHFQMIRW